MKPGRILRCVVGWLCDSTKINDYIWYRRWTGGVWYHVRVILDPYCGLFWSRWGAGEFDHVEKDIAVEVYAKDANWEDIVEGDLVKLDNVFCARVLTVNLIYIYFGTSIRCACSDGRHYEPDRLVLAKG